LFFFSLIYIYILNIDKNENIRKIICSSMSQQLIGTIGNEFWRQPNNIVYAFYSENVFLEENKKQMIISTDTEKKLQ